LRSSYLVIAFYDSPAKVIIIGIIMDLLGKVKTRSNETRFICKKLNYKTKAQYHCLISQVN